MLKDNRTLFEQEDDYYNPKKVRKAWNNNHTEYETNGNKDKTYHQKNNLHYGMKELSRIQKEFQICNPLQINISGKEKVIR